MTILPHCMGGWSESWPADKAVVCPQNDTRDKDGEGKPGRAVVGAAMLEAVETVTAGSQESLCPLSVFPCFSRTWARPLGSRATAYVAGEKWSDLRKRSVFWPGNQGTDEIVFVGVLKNSKDGK